MDALHMSGWSCERLGDAGFSSTPLTHQLASVSMPPKRPDASSGVISNVATVASRIHMLLQHFLVIHLVDVIAGKNDDVTRVLAAYRINILIHGVGGAEIPVRGDAHLRRQNFDELAEAQQLRPPLANVPVKRKRFVLRQNKYAAQVAIDAVGKSDVDDSIDAAKWHGRLGAVARQRPEPFALSSSQ